MDISAKRLDPADNLNLLRAPSRVSQSASLPALLHLPPPSPRASVCILKWQTIIRTWGPSSLQKRDPRELPLCHKCRRQAEAQADADAEAEAAAWWKRQKLMDVYAGSTGIATVQQSLSPLCVCVLPLCASLCLIVPQRKSFATGMDSSLALSDWALWSDCGSNLCFNFSLKTMHNLQFHC